MDVTISTLKTILGEHDGALLNDATRLELQNVLRGAADETETQYDTIMRLYDSHLQAAMVQVGSNLGLFKLLCDREGEGKGKDKDSGAGSGPLTVEEAARRTGADPLLLARILRYLASHRFIREAGRDAFEASKVTRNLADGLAKDAISFIFNIAGPGYQALPSFMEAHRYQNTLDRTPFQAGFDTDLDFFAWVRGQPEALRWFQSLMAIPRWGDWLDVLPDMREEVAEAERAEAAGGEKGQEKKKRVLFVDVGGGAGHQCRRLVERYPEMRGRVVLQDLEESIAAAPKVEGVEAMVQDFFAPQQVKGAKYYYLRSILHDWPDEAAVRILRALAPALAADSRVLLDERVVPDEGAHWQPSTLDLHMYVMVGAMERTAAQWHALLARAGLRVAEVRRYSPAAESSIIYVVPE